MDPLTRAELRSLRSLARRRVRERRGEVLVEGWRALDAALDHPGCVHLIALTAGAVSAGLAPEVMKRAEAQGLAVRALSDEDAAGISGTENPQGVFARVRWAPTPASEPGSLPDVLEEAGVRTLLGLDGIADPGNVGTLLRTAAAFGVGGVLAGAGTVELTNPKVVRSSAGCLFALRWVQALADLGETAAALSEAGWSVYRAEASAGEPPEQLPASSRWLLLLGSEAHGLDPALVRVGTPVHLSLHPGAESLNVAVAGSILTYLLQAKDGAR